MLPALHDETPADLLAGEACTALLGMDIEAEPLRRELESLEGAGDWRHQRPYSAGVVGEPISTGWTCLPLRSPGGLLERTDPGGPGRLAFADTPVLTRLPTFRRLLQRFPCELRSARLLALDPGTRLEEHRDEFVGFEYGQLRLHVPVVTNPGAVLTMEGQRHHWEPGELWYGNFTLPHSVGNEGAIRRVHLVVDCLLDEPLLRLFPEWFRERVRALAFVRNRPRCVPVPLSTVPEFLLPQAMATDLLAYLSDGDLPRDPGALASVKREDGELVLRTGRGVACTLVPVGPHEYRFQGWTDERTLSFDALPRVVVLNDRRRFGHRRWLCPCTS